jgi:hypothetical protein
MRTFQCIGYIDMPNLNNITVREMSPEQWQQFIDQWIHSWAESLIVECEMSVGDAYCQADIDWERYSGQEGWTGRDEMILMKREGYSYGWGEM